MSKLFRIQITFNLQLIFFSTLFSVIIDYCFQAARLPFYSADIPSVKRLLLPVHKWHALFFAMKLAHLCRPNISNRQ